MRRRDLLAALGTGTTTLAGCAGVVGDKDTTIRPAEEVGKMRLDCSHPADPRQRTDRFTVASDSAPSGMLGEFSIGIVAPMTDDHPARLKGWFTCTASTPTKYSFVDDFGPIPISQGNAQDGDDVLVLTLPRHGGHTNGCWQGGIDYNDSVVSSTLHPGETICNEMALYDGGNDECFPPGEYTFRMGIWREKDNTYQDFGVTVTVRENEA